MNKAVKNTLYSHKGSFLYQGRGGHKTQVRGEIVIVVAGAEPPETPQAQDVVSLVLERVDAGERLKNACTAVAAETGASKRELYEAALAARNANV